MLSAVVRKYNPKTSSVHWQRIVVGLCVIRKKKKPSTPSL